MRSVLLLFIGLSSAAQDVSLKVRVLDATDRPLERVQIGTANATVVTAKGGIAIIRLPKSYKPGDPVTLQVVPPPDLRIVAPVHGRAIVPTDSPEAFVDVMVVSLRDMQALQKNGALLYAIIARSQSSSPPEPARPKTEPVKPRRTGRLSDFGPFAFGFSPQAASEAGRSSQRTLDRLVTEEAAKEFGFTKAEVERALASWEADALTWKLIVLTATVEMNGLDPFSTVFWGEDDLYFGVGTFNVRNGTLPALLREFRSLNATVFDAIVGENAGVVNKLMKASSSDARQISLEVAGERHRVPEKWKDLFRQLGRQPEFQRVQIKFLKPKVEQSRRRVADLGLRSERAAAFSYDLLFQHGPSPRVWNALPEDRAAFRQEFGREADEQECLVLLANEAGASVPAPLGARIRARGLTFALGHGRVYLREVNLEQAGIGLRDVDTGEPIKVTNDPAILRRLTEENWPVGTRSNR